MPNAALSAAIEEAYAVAGDDPVLHTLEIRHPSFTTPIRVVLDHQDLTATLEAGAPVDPGAAVTFAAYAFELKLPAVGTGQVGDLEIVVDNVSTEINAALDQAAQSAALTEITYRPYLLSDLSGPSWNPPLTMSVKSASADVYGVVFRAGFGNGANRVFPGEAYTLTRFPGLALT